MILLACVFITLATGYGHSPPRIRLLDSIKGIQTEEVWTYNCTENGCSKILVDKNCKEESCKNDGEPIVSEEVCNLLCHQGNLWPQPSGQLEISNTYVVLDTYNVRLDMSEQLSRIGNKEFNIPAVANIFLERFQNLGGSKTAKSSVGRGVILNLQIENPNLYKFETGADEGYSLFIKQTADNWVNVTIIGNTFFGLRHGLETLSQLIVFDGITNSPVSPSEVTIVDKPAYTHRGMMIDTARNYLSVPTIKRTINAMSSVKLNTLHWHITDSHSFPFVSKSYPLLSKYGAYSPEKVYSEKDITEIVEYARLRGIRVVPELDLPAHVGEGWQAVPGAVVCFNAQPWREYCVEPPCGQVDPTSNIVYDVLKGLYSDFNKLFDADLFHMGGDEVNINCWNTTDVITDNMKKLDLERTTQGFLQLWSNFQSKAKELVKSEGGKDKQFVLWTSTLTEGDVDSYLNNTEYIIQVWTRGNSPEITHLLQKGYKIILSNYDALYFDCGFGAWIGNGNNWCSPYIPWQKVYENTPDRILNDLGLGDEYKKLVLGNEAALWAEQVDDSSIDNRLWPRGAALAESLWSPGKSWHDAEKRYLMQRERFVKAGICADTVEPEWCRQNQGSCY